MPTNMMDFLAASASSNCSTSGITIEKTVFGNTPFALLTSISCTVLPKAAAQQQTQQQCYPRLQHNNKHNNSVTQGCSTTTNTTTVLPKAAAQQQTQQQKCITITAKVVPQLTTTTAPISSLGRVRTTTTITVKWAGLSVHKHMTSHSR